MSSDTRKRRPCGRLFLSVVGLDDVDSELEHQQLQDAELVGVGAGLLVE